MGGNGCDYDGPGGLPTQDFKTDCGDDSAEGRRRGMGVGLSGYGAGGNMDFSDKGVREEAAGKKSEYVTGRPIYKPCTCEDQRFIET